MSRYYLTGRALGGVDFLSLPQGGYDITQADALVGGFTTVADALAHVRPNNRREWTWLLSTSKTEGGALTDWRVNGVNDPAMTAFDVMFSRWLTNPLDSQTINGTFDIIWMVGASAGAVGRTRLKLYVTVGNTDTVRGVLLDYTDATTQWATPGTSKFVKLSAAQTLTPVNALAGDRICLELAVRFTYNSGASTDTYAIMKRGTTNGSAGSPYADAAYGSVNLTTEVGSINFSATIVEQAAPAAPPHDACVDATVITALPYLDIVEDTTVANDTADAARLRSVWYSFTPTETADYGITTFGSNYRTEIKVYTGSCGATSNKSPIYGLELGHQWLGAATSEVTFNATAGVPLLIRVASVVETSPSGVCARNSGGYLKFRVFKIQVPQKGDLIISAQHVAMYRDGELINISSNFFGDTPTGAAIDDTHRPIPDGGAGYVDHVADRFLATLFGFELIEFFDLTTLDRNSAEVTFLEMDSVDISAPLRVPNGSHPSSLVMDEEGNLFVGFFGDNYSVLGQNPTDPATAYVRKFTGDVTFGDGSHPRAENLGEFQVDIELGGSDYIELSSDQKTLFYTSAGTRVMRFDTQANVQLADFAVWPLEVGVPRPGLRGLRLLPPGDGTGGLLVANGINILRFDSLGNHIQTYSPSLSYVADLDKLELSPDGESFFYVTDQLSTTLFKFNIATGVEMSITELDLPTGQLCGFTNNGGYRAGRPSSSITSEPPSGPPPVVIPPSTETPIDCCDHGTGPPVEPPPPAEPPPEVPPFEEECGFGGLMGDGNLVTFAEDWRVA